MGKFAMRRIISLVIILLVATIGLTIGTKLKDSPKWFGDRNPLGGVFDFIGDSLTESIAENFTNGAAADAAERAMGSLENVVGSIKSKAYSIKEALPSLSSGSSGAASASSGSSSSGDDPLGAVPEDHSHDTSPSLPAYTQTEGLTVEFLYVGQADCELIYTDDSVMLIDAGNIADGPLLVDYLKSLGIEYIDYIVGTHAHEDHIGGMDDVIEAFNAGTIILPVVTADSGVYSYVERAAQESSANVVQADVGATYSLGNATFTILSCNPVSSLADVAETDYINESSVVIRLDYDDSSFLFTGDMEKANEYALIDEFVDIDVDVLKVAHHGSLTSSAREFIDLVSPDVGVISAGINNQYNHPSKGTLETLQDCDVAVLRTDLLGSIRINTDGESYTIEAFESDTDGNTSSVANDAA